MTNCPPWCTAHDDPTWDAASHFSDSERVRVLTPHAGGVQEHELELALRGEGARVWVELAPTEAGGPLLTLDAGGAREVAGAMLALLQGVI